MSGQEAGPRSFVAAAILQAPVSDREFFDHTSGTNPDAVAWLKRATELVEAGKGSEWLPKEASKAFHLSDETDEKHLTLYNAYRFHSLFAKG
jgi:hypothetical protein